MRLCKFCGKPFEPSSNRQVYCKRDHIRICPVCGKEYVEHNVENLKRPPIACSYECRAKKTQATSLSKYGCKAPGNNPEARKKAKATTLMHHGVEYAMQSSEVKKKSTESVLRKYGVDNVGKSPEVIAKRMDTCRERYGDVLPFNSSESYQKQHKTIQEKYGVPFASLIPHVQDSTKVGHISQVNKAFAEQLQELGVEVELEKRIESKWFDLYLPELDTVIEIDPTYAHSAIPVGRLEGVDKYYHRNKTALAESKGLRCIHVFDWDDKSKIAKSLAVDVMLDAREFQVYRLTKSACNEFLEQNSLEPIHRGSILQLGLVAEKEIYQVMTFGLPTNSKHHTAQIYNMCTKLGYCISGGYDLLSHAASEFGLYNIIAYCNRAKYIGSELEAIGMRLVRRTQPRLFWSKGSKFVSSSILYSNRAEYKNSQQLLAAGYLPVYDCGQLVFESAD